MSSMYREELKTGKDRGAVARGAIEACATLRGRAESGCVFDRNTLVSGWRRVTEGKRRITRQLLLIAALERAHRDTAPAEALLDSLIRTQALLERSWHTIAGNMGRPR